jgi:hypothetical protein
MHIIHIEPLAPAKPAIGATCNGCGVCCLSEPCPLGVLLFLKRKGSCQALQWDAGGKAYRCGVMVDPAATSIQALSPPFQFFAGPLAFVLKQGARRWIASGIGCDSSLEPVPSQLPYTPQDSN